MQLVHIFAVDVVVFELIQLCSLNGLDLVTLGLDVLSDLSAFFEIVKSVLLLDVFVG